MQLDFHVLDVFTNERFAGNPLAVVHGADGLQTAQMQKIAREFNLSETVFVMRAANPAHSARVRIFTPVGELPFAGHPTVGTATLLAELRLPGTGGTHDALVVLEENIGVVRVGVRFRNGQAPFAEFDAPRLPLEDGPAATSERIAVALGLLPSEIGFQNHRPSRYSAGVPYTFVPVSSLQAIGKAAMNAAAWGGAFAKDSHSAAYLYCRECVHTTSNFHARMFFPGVGEDPATGSAAAAFAAVIARFDTPLDGTHKRIIEQGFEMGRPSLISLQLEIVRAKLAAVRIGGHAVRVSEGRISV